MRLSVLLLSATLLSLGLFLSPAAAQAKGTVSFTFDDGAKTIAANGLPVFKKYGVPATIYLSTAYIGVDSWYMDWNQVKKLRSAGWEIASHGHEHVDMTKLAPSALDTNLDTSVSVLKRRGYSAYSFATPYGAYDDSVVSAAERRFCSHRQAWDASGPADEGFNEPGKLDVYRISATELKNGMSMSKLKKLIARAESRGEWLVFLAHGVVKSKAGDYEITKSKLDKMVAYVKSRQDAGKIDIRTVADMTGKCPQVK